MENSKTGKVKTCMSTVISSEEKLVKVFNDFFVNIAPNIGINTYKVNEAIISEVNFMVSIIE